MIRKWFARRQKRECPQVLEALRAFEENHELGDDELSGCLNINQVRLNDKLTERVFAFAKTTAGAQRASSEARESGEQNK